MSKKLNISDKIETVTYKGCVTIEYFDIVKGKKVINAYNAGTSYLFNSLARALRGDTFDIPDSIMLYKGNNDTTDKILASPIPYTTTPLLYSATYNGSDYTYLAISADNQLANCLGYTFIIPKGSFINVESDTKITRLALLNSKYNTTFATLTLDIDKQFTADNTSNIQIMWKLIFK